MKRFERGLERICLLDFFSWLQYSETTFGAMLVWCLSINPCKVINETKFNFFMIWFLPFMF
jgi:hypothetical protein